MLTDPQCCGLPYYYGQLAVKLSHTLGIGFSHFVYVHDSDYRWSLKEN